MTIKQAGTACSIQELNNAKTSVILEKKHKLSRCYENEVCCKGQKMATGHNRRGRVYPAGVHRDRDTLCEDRAGRGSRQST